MMMRSIKYIFLCIVVCSILFAPTIDARKRKKNKSTKTKTKWSSTLDGPDNTNSILATEEHGYYIKRTYVAADGTLRSNISHIADTLKTVPYLAIPIAWFPCNDDAVCNNYPNIFNAGLNAMSEGFLCDDDCKTPYEPICGKTPREIAVFYNKCKLNVAKCRTHGLWTDYPLEECQKTYSKEIEYAEQKFKTSPYFRTKENEPVSIGNDGAAAAAIAGEDVSNATSDETKIDKIKQN